jgi:hypothetical protein
MLWGAPNVPWELSQDVIQMGRALLTEKRQRLSPENRRKIETLVADAERFPSKWRKDISREENVSAMEYPRWMPFRTAATELLTKLPYIDADSFTS